MDANNSQKIQELQTSVKRYARLATPQAFSLKAKDLMQLAKLTNQNSYMEQAIEAWTHAIEKKPDAIYYCERAKAYNAVGEPEKAVDDFRQAQTLSSKDDGDILKNFHTNNMMKEIAKLDQVKNVINKMKSQNKLPSQFLGAFQDLTNTTQRLVMKVGVHEGRLNDHDDLINKMTSRIEMLEKGMSGKEDKGKVAEMEQQMHKYIEIYKNFQEKIGTNSNDGSYQSAIKELQQKIKGLEGNVKQVEAKVEKVQVELKKLVHHNEAQFNKIKTQIKKVNGTIDAFHGKFKVIEGQVNSVNQKIIYMDQELKKGLYPKNQVKDQMEKWKKQDPQVYEYAHNFYWVLNNYLLSYRVASTGMFDGKEPNPTFFEKFFPACVNAITSALSLVPIVGQAVDLLKTVIETVFEEYKSRKFQLTVRKMNLLIKYDSEEDLSLAVGKGVVQLCKMPYKMEEIKDLKKNKKSSVDKNPFTEAKQQFDKEIEYVIKKANNFKIEEQSQVYTLVVEDIAALIGYILREQISEQNPIQTAIVEGFKGGQNSPIGKSLVERYEKGKAPETSSAESCCLIY